MAHWPGLGNILFAFVGRATMHLKSSGFSSEFVIGTRTPLTSLPVQMVGFEVLYYKLLLYLQIYRVSRDNCFTVKDACEEMGFENQLK